MREGWTEHDSKTFLRDADCFVPERDLLFESVCQLVPDCIQSDLVVELCCGDGSLSEVILDQIEGVRVLAMDGSEAMLQACCRRPERFGDRIEIRRFDLAGRDWRRFAESPRAIVSTFAIHHLPDSAKQDLYRDLAAQLAPGGVLAIADLIRPASAVSTGLAAWQWDEAVKERSIRTRGDLSAFRTFQAERWNHHAVDDPDPIDQPALLTDQLRWLSDAGLEGVDVHWSKGGMSLFSGIRM
ncbi:MAG: class I SAM-dependent methyltransferase [Bryobacterales bacterium]|nr:class I SAM-dependent methyltransferase [Bryobacterales bacterium]